MRLCIVMGILLLNLPLAASGTTFQVCPDGSGDFLTVQAAINVSTGGDIIELCDATFTGVGNRDLDYLGKAITVRSQSGNPQACVIDCEGSPGTPYRGFYFHSGEGNDSLLEGLTITNAFSMAPGGGICCDGASPTITECIFLENLCPDNGAGLLCSNGAPILTDCQFIRNGDGTGGGGAGMACFLSSSPSLTDCMFEDNQAQAGGAGLFCAGGSSPSLTRCTFTGNLLTAPNGYGGGLFCYYYASPVLVDCDFIDNVGGLGGGAAFNDHCDPSLTGCFFSGNSSQNGGGAYCILSSLPAFDGCTFSNNTAAIYGGGIWCSASSPDLVSCTFCGNSAGTNGGCLHLNQSSPSLERTILAFSTSGEAVYCYDTACFPTLDCCDAYGNAGGDWVGCIASQAGLNGNISLDPLFCDAANEDYKLQDETSPCAPFSEPNTQCDLIGAWPVGCESSEVSEGFFDQSAANLAVSPNPFATTTQIRYTIPPGSENAQVVLNVFDPTGRLVRTLVDTQASVQTDEISWDGRDQSGVSVQTGIYFVQLGVGFDTVSRRLVVMR